MWDPEPVDTHMLQEYLLRTTPDTAPCSAPTKEVYLPSKPKKKNDSDDENQTKPICFLDKSLVQRQP
jgi:hypothetical protein